MRMRTAKKIVAAEGIVPGAARWTGQQYTAAHRAWCRGCRRGARTTGVRLAMVKNFDSTPRKPAGLAIQGARYLTSGDNRYLYLLDTGADRWILPTIKTARQEKMVRAMVARFGGTPETITGTSLIVDGDAFVRTAPREWAGKPVVIAVNFRMRGVHIAHQTVTTAGFDAQALLAKWRAEDPFHLVVEA